MSDVFSETGSIPMILSWTSSAVAGVYLYHTPMGAGNKKSDNFHGTQDAAGLLLLRSAPTPFSRLPCPLLKLANIVLKYLQPENLKSDLNTNARNFLILLLCKCLFARSQTLRLWAGPQSAIAVARCG